MASERLVQIKVVLPESAWAQGIQQEFALSQQRNPFQSTRLLLDGQQRLTSLSAVIRGEPVSGRGSEEANRIAVQPGTTGPF
jgi:hypothetical protein